MNFFELLRMRAGEDYYNGPMLHDLARDIAAAIDALQVMPSADNMIKLNNLWSHADRQLRLSRGEDPFEKGHG